MRVLHVIPSLSLTKGGPTPITINMVKSLRQHGVDACVMTSDDDGTNRLKVPLHEWTPFNDIPVYFLPRFKYPLKEFIYTPSALHFLKSNINDFDIIHTHYLFSYLPWVAALQARKMNKPYVMTPYGMLTPAAKSHRFLKKYMFFYAERNLLRTAAGIHCSTRAEVENVQQFGVKGNTFVNPYIVMSAPTLTNPREELCTKYGIPHDHTIILFLARVHPIKQPDIIIQCADQLIREGKKIHVIIAGSGDTAYIEQLKTMATAGAAAKHITFAGFTAGRDRDVLYQGADIYALPTHSENFGMTICEALDARTPVAITTGVQIAEDLKNSGSALVSEPTFSSFYKHLNLLVEDPQLRKSIADNGCQWVRSQYSSHQTGLDLKGIYSSILAQGASTGR